MTRVGASAYMSQRRGHMLQEIEQKQMAPELYPYNSRGPVGSHYLAAKYGVRWGDMTDNPEEVI